MVCFDCGLLRFDVSFCGWCLGFAICLHWLAWSWCLCMVGV